MLPTGDADTRAALRRWLDTWQRVGPEREAERLQALRALDDAESARIARDLVWPLGTLDNNRGGDDAAGLITMKALLRKLGPGA